jgi:hypothetical protein
MMVRHRSLLQFFRLAAVAVVAILEHKLVNQVVLAAVAVMRQQERVGLEIHRLEALHKGTMAVMVRHGDGLGGGGGGAGAAGTAAVAGPPAVAGPGGGKQNSITGTSPAPYYGGGGGGAANTGTAGTGGLGGGGAGGASSGPGTNANPNTGGGGGGSSGGTAVGSGGSGIVIIKIPDTKTATFTGGVTETNSTAGGYKLML